MEKAEKTFMERVNYYSKEPCSTDIGLFNYLLSPILDSSFSNRLIFQNYG
jgi:hypothetical protein